MRSSQLFTIPEEEEELPYDRLNQDDGIHYTVVHLPPRKEEKKEVEKEEVAIQTTLVEEEPPQIELKEPELPREVLPPVVPQIIIQQTLPPPQQTPVTVAADSSEREKDLMELIRTIISTQEKTMQGQQALLLTLLQQQLKETVPDPPVKEEESYGEEDFEEVEVPPPSPPKIEEVEEKKEIDELIQEEVKEIQGEVEFPPLIKEEKKKVHYNTCFGEFLLSGKQLYGKYAVPEKLPFNEYLRQLEEEGDSSKAKIAIEEPRLRRRASPLTMKLLFPTNPPAKLNTKPQPLSASFDQTSDNKNDGFVQFANKLLDTLSQPRSRSDVESDAAVSKKEITKAVHDGIASGIKQVLGYFPDSKIRQEAEKEEREKKQTPYFQEMWTRKDSDRRDRPVRDPLQPLSIMKEIEKSKSSYHRLIKPHNDPSGRNNEDEMNSVEYNDSISLSEGYDAFNDDVDDPVSNVRQTNRKKASIMTRFINSEMSDDANDDQEDTIREYFASDIHYDSKDSDVEEVHEPQGKSKDISRSQQESIKSGGDTAVRLPPLVSSLLEQQETKKVIYQQKLSNKPKKHRTSSFTSSEGEENNRAVREAMHLSDEEEDDDALISLQLSEESRHREKSARRRPSRYDTTNEDEESYPSEEDSNVQYHHDHRRLHHPTRETHQTFTGDDSFSSTSSASPSRYHQSMMSEEDAENLSIPTAEDSSIDGFGAVRKHTAEETISIAHKTRYSLSEVRMKRKDLLSSWNHKRKKSSLLLNYDAQSTGMKGATAEGGGGEGGREEVNVSISEDNDRRDEQGSYNSLLSSEESSIMSERLKLLRKKNRRWIDQFKEKTMRTGEEEGKGEGKDDEGEGRNKSGSRPLYPNSDSMSNSEMEFSVNTPLSNSSISDTPRVTSNRLIGNRRGKNQTSGGGSGGVNVSIPLLNIDVRQYSNRPRWH